MQLHVVDQVREASLSLDVTLKDKDTFFRDARRNGYLWGSGVSFRTDEQRFDARLLEEGKRLIRRQVRGDQGYGYCDLEQCESQNWILLATKSDPIRIGKSRTVSHHAVLAQNTDDFFTCRLEFEATVSLS